VDRSAIAAQCTDDRVPECAVIDAFSGLGFAIGRAALPITWVVSRRKLHLPDELGSRALRTDAIESIACGCLSFVVVFGLLAQLAIGAWWIDAVTSLALVWKDARRESGRG
jgi:divalent metal cation (Fe/Co/Zn/Cd) transporter